MPELPEVETLKRELSRVLVGKKFEDTGKKILGIERRAKILIFHLSGGEVMLVHLKMTGQLVYENRGSTLRDSKVEPRFRHTRKVFTFTDGSRLFFNDLRKFGWHRFMKENELPKFFAKTGVEPLSKDFTRQNFAKILARFPKRKIKPFLLDQSLVAGLGNIYADESCFLAKILPTRIIKSLTPDNIEKLHQSIITVLKHAIKNKGTSSRDYVRANGQPGDFVPHLKVYGRGNEECKICRGKISKIKFAGRGTHFCPRCQK